MKLTTSASVKIINKKILHLFFKSLIIYNLFTQFEQMELEIREIPSAEEKSRQNNHLASFKAELKRLQLEYNSTRRRVQRKTLLNNHSEEDSNYLEVGIFQKIS